MQSEAFKKKSKKIISPIQINILSVVNAGVFRSDVHLHNSIFIDFKLRNLCNENVHK